MSGIEAGFCAGHSKGWVFADRDKQRRLQNLAGQNAEEMEAGHGIGERAMGESARGVLQYAHAVDFICKSNKSLCPRGHVSKFEGNLDYEKHTTQER